jgi:hypothetical protein
MWATTLISAMSGSSFVAIVEPFWPARSAYAEPADQVALTLKILPCEGNAGRSASSVSKKFVSQT